MKGVPELGCCYIRLRTSINVERYSPEIREKVSELRKELQGFDRKADNRWTMKIPLRV